MGVFVEEWNMRQMTKIIDGRVSNEAFRIKEGNLSRDFTRATAYGMYYPIIGVCGELGVTLHTIILSR